VPLLTAGLLANLTCIQAELYEMEAAMSVGEDPLWIIPYTTIAVDFQDLLDDYTTYIDVIVASCAVVYGFHWATHALHRTEVWGFH